MHSLLVLGSPDSLRRRIEFFGSATYECGGFAFSLSEIDHCVLRFAMTRPASMLAGFFLPAHFSERDPRRRLALDAPDVRINFALNCGSASCLPRIPVYRLDLLNRQLDASTALFLEQFVSVSLGRRTVELPSVFDWFALDFRGGKSLNAVQYVIDFLRTWYISHVKHEPSSEENYGSRQSRAGMLESLTSLMADPRSLTVKFSAYSWSFPRKLRLFTESDLIALESSVVVPP